LFISTVLAEPIIEVESDGTVGVYIEETSYRLGFQTLSIAHEGLTVYAIDSSGNAVIDLGTKAGSAISFYEDKDGQVLSLRGSQIPDIQLVLDASCSMGLRIDDATIQLDEFLTVEAPLKVITREVVVPGGDHALQNLRRVRHGHLADQVVVHRLDEMQLALTVRDGVAM
jgi:hypothetical protein